MNIVLDVISGASWSMVYICAIVIGFKYKTWCIPKLSICLNLSWEFWVVFDRVSQGEFKSIAFIIQIVWLLLDFFILLTLLFYDNAENKNIWNNILLFVIVFVLMNVLTCQAGLWEVIAFLINAIMSGLFIYRMGKDFSHWHSKVIALGKLLGTMAATILYGIIQWNILILWIGGICLFLDVVYFVMLQRNLRKL